MYAQNVNFEEYQSLLAGSKPVLVDFWAPWCGPCRRIEAAYEKAAQQFGQEVAIVKVNIDEEGALAQQENIQFIPTLVFYRNGNAVASTVAPGSKAEIDAFIRESMEK